MAAIEYIEYESATPEVRQIFDCYYGDAQHGLDQQFLN
jgi:hypothetical protein